MNPNATWWRADSGTVHDKVIAYVAEVERAQFEQFNAFHRLAMLYNPAANRDPFERKGRKAQMVENVIASNVDTVHAVVASTEIQPRIMTDDAEWSVQRMYRKVSQYAEVLGKKLKVHEIASQCFKDGALKGTGLGKVWVDPITNDIRIERVRVDDIVVDEGEARNSNPRQMHQRMLVDREELGAAWPEKRDEIMAAHGGRDASLSSRYWANYRPVGENEIVVIESWKLPIGRKGSDGYVPGRRTVCIDGCDLEDEEWHHPFFPFAVFRWSTDDEGWYGIGLAERIAGHQRTLNKANWQIDRQLDQHAVPTTYVQLADANLSVKSVGRAGTIVPVKGDIPKTILPQAVSGEQFRRREEIKASAFEESGVSRTTANAQKPSGLDSGAALREWKDQTTQRFAQQEKGHERFVLDLIWLGLYFAKELGKDAPQLLPRARYARKDIEWSKVDLDYVSTNLYASSNISRTPAGRLQLALEWAQAGVITQDEARRLMRHPDTERAMSLYTAALEDIERCIEEVLDGAILVPEPYQNLKMGNWRFQQAYLKAHADGAPEEILEALRQWMVQASAILAGLAQPAPAGLPAADPMGPSTLEAGPAMPAAPDGSPGDVMAGAGVTAANLMQ